MFVQVLRASAIANSTEARTALVDPLEPVLDGAVEVIESSEVDLSMGGGSDEAGFVQVFGGHGQRAEARAALLRAEPILRRERPDILGGITICQPDGRFIDVAYFRSEDEAREGEGRELSAEGRAVFEQFGRYLAAVEFLDLSDPVLL